MLYYADEKRIIFGGSFGLFIYDTVNLKMLRSVDLVAIGCSYTQGDKYCEIQVSEDGQQVYLHPMNVTDMYIYDVEKNSLKKEAYDLTGVSIYKTRIELRQIGARDKARTICGIGQCGRPLCCSTFLNHIDSVTMNMAKNQNIALNPSKINGLCGELFLQRFEYQSQAALLLLAHVGRLQVEDFGCYGLETLLHLGLGLFALVKQIGRASCRERVSFAV